MYAEVVKFLHASLYRLFSMNSPFSLVSPINSAGWVILCHQIPLQHQGIWISLIETLPESRSLIFVIAQVVYLPVF